MKITCSTGAEINDPTLEQIIDVLSGLDDRENNYAILSQNEQNYIQTSGNVIEGFRIEYQEGSWRDHFLTARDDISFGEVVDSFKQYAQQDASFKENFDWFPEDDTPPCILLTPEKAKKLKYVTSINNNRISTSGFFGKNYKFTTETEEIEMINKLINEGYAFVYVDPSGWSPADILEYFQEKGLLKRKFTAVIWNSEGCHTFEVLKR
jgi:hypothetical protein